MIAWKGMLDRYGQEIPLLHTHPTCANEDYASSYSCEAIPKILNCTIGREDYSDYLSEIATMP